MPNKVLCHPDEVSGTTVTDDGRKFFWSEGRGSIVVVLHPDGKKEMFYASSKHPLNAELSRLDEKGYDEYLSMTPEQEAEYERETEELSDGRWMKYLSHG